MRRRLLVLLSAAVAVGGLRFQPQLPKKPAVSNTQPPFQVPPPSDAHAAVMVQQDVRPAPRIVRAWRILRTDLIGRTSNRIALAVSSGLSGREGLRRRRKEPSARASRHGDKRRGTAASGTPVMSSSAALSPIVVSAPAAGTTRRRDGSTPSVEQVKARHYLIRKLVWLDTEGLLQRFARQQPWESGAALQDHLRALEHRSPIIQWTFRHQARSGPRLLAPHFHSARSSPA